MFKIYDLDMTVIDSSHRQVSLPNGDLDLANWLDNAVRENIFKDTLMPLADDLRASRGHYVTAICTSRMMTAADFEFLFAHDLTTDHIMYRHEGDMRGCGEMKLAKLTDWFEDFGLHPAEGVFFEDSESVTKTLAAEMPDLRIVHPNRWSV